MKQMAHEAALNAVKAMTTAALESRYSHILWLLKNAPSDVSWRNEVATERHYVHQELGNRGAHVAWGA